MRAGELFDAHDERTCDSQALEEKRAIDCFKTCVDQARAPILRHKVRTAREFFSSGAENREFSMNRRVKERATKLQFCK